MEKFIFYILAGLMIVSAILSVTSRKMLRSVIYLLFTLIGVAGIYFLLDYNFLAAVQLTVYAGGIVVLVIFSVLLVHHIEMELEKAAIIKKVFTALLCIGGLSLFLITIYTADFKEISNDKTTTVSQVGKGLLSYESGGFILPFEVISILLLASMVGAIIIGKGDKLTKNENLQ